jgi:hypothetical protein
MYFNASLSFKCKAVTPATSWNTHMSPCCCIKQLSHKTETGLLRFPNSKKLKEKK